MAGELLRVDVGDLTFDVRASGPEDGRPVLRCTGDVPEAAVDGAALPEPAVSGEPGARLRHR